MLLRLVPSSADCFGLDFPWAVFYEVREYVCFGSIFTWLSSAYVLERDARFGKRTHAICDRTIRVAYILIHVV